MLAIEAELRSGPTVYRYRCDDGLPGREGGFHLCTAWLIEAYLRTGRRADAEELFEQMLDVRRPDRAAARGVRPGRPSAAWATTRRRTATSGLIRCALLLEQPTARPSP